MCRSVIFTHQMTLRLNESEKGHKKKTEIHRAMIFLLSERMTPKRLLWQISAFFCCCCCCIFQRNFSGFTDHMNQIVNAFFPLSALLSIQIYIYVYMYRLISHTGMDQLLDIQIHWPVRAAKMFDTFTESK